MNPRKDLCCKSVSCRRPMLCTDSKPTKFNLHAWKQAALFGCFFLCWQCHHNLRCCALRKIQCALLIQLKFQVDESVPGDVCKIHTGHSLGALLASLASTSSHAEEPAVVFASPGQLSAAEWLGKFQHANVRLDYIDMEFTSVCCKLLALFLQVCLLVIFKIPTISTANMIQLYFCQSLGEIRWGCFLCRWAHIHNTKRHVECSAPVWKKTLLVMWSTCPRSVQSRLVHDLDWISFITFVSDGRPVSARGSNRSPGLRDLLWSTPFWPDKPHHSMWSLLLANSHLRPLSGFDVSPKSLPNVHKSANRTAFGNKNLATQGQAMAPNSWKSVSVVFTHTNFQPESLCNSLCFSHAERQQQQHKEPRKWCWRNECSLNCQTDLSHSTRAQDFVTVALLWCSTTEHNMHAWQQDFRMGRKAWQNSVRPILLTGIKHVTRNIRQRHRNSAGQAVLILCWNNASVATTFTGFQLVKTYEPIPQ